MAFLAIIKGHQSNQKKVLKSVLWFICLYFIGMTAVLDIAVIVASISGNIATLFANQMDQTAFMIVLIVALIGYALLSVGLYLWSKKEFNKGVNVD